MTDGSAVGSRITWSQKSLICPSPCVFTTFMRFSSSIFTMYLRLPQIYAFVHKDIKSRNINEGEAVLKSGQIVTIHEKKETRIIHGDTRKITDGWVK